ncbi:MAG TPA: DNA repair protein RadC [bacterium]
MPIMRIKDWPEADRPREKLYEQGTYGLTDAELLAILIGKGTRNITALDIARRLLNEYGTLKNLGERPVVELEKLKIPGLGRAKIVTIIAGLELGKRSLSRKGEKEVLFNKPHDVFDYYAPYISGLKHELFKVAAVNGKNKLLKDTTISKGILDTSITHPREVFKFALAESASGLFLIHNHPSGIMKPSDDDLRITERLRSAGEIMGMRIIDHIIVSDSGFYSFAEHNLL